MTKKSKGINEIYKKFPWIKQAKDDVVKRFNEEIKGEIEERTKKARQCNLPANYRLTPKTTFVVPGDIWFMNPSSLTSPKKWHSLDSYAGQITSDFILHARPVLPVQVIYNKIRYRVVGSEYRIEKIADRTGKREYVILENADGVMKVLLEEVVKNMTMTIGYCEF